MLNKESVCCDTDNKYLKNNNHDDYVTANFIGEHIVIIR